MRLEIGTSKARVSLDQGMRVTALEVHTHYLPIIRHVITNHYANLKLDNAPEGVNARDLLEQAQVMPSPQDLRFIVSYISSANERATALLRDMTEIRKHCIAKHISTKQIEVCFSNQTVACLIVHDSYPDVPNGIYIASIRGEDNQLPNVFENIREAANAEVMHSVIDAVKFLKKKMDI